MIIPRTTPLLDPQTSGRENIMGSRCALRWFGDGSCPACGRSKRYRGHFFQLETCSVRFVPGISSYGRRDKNQFSSERTPCHPGFEWTISGLHHESVDARWEHLSVHSSEPGCRLSDARMCTSVEISGNNLLTTSGIACTSVPWPHASSQIGYFTRQY